MQKEQKERKERLTRVRVEFEKKLGAKLREMLPARDKVLIMQYLLEQDENKLQELSESLLPAFITITAQQLVDHELNKFMEVYELFKQEADEDKTAKSESVKAKAEKVFGKAL